MAPLLPLPTPASTHALAFARGLLNLPGPNPKPLPLGSLLILGQNSRFLLIGLDLFTFLDVQNYILHICINIRDLL